MPDDKQKPKEIKIHFPENLRGGVYANNMYVTHSREEFILDFMVWAPGQNTITARVIVSPGHMKRIIKALRENLSRYEKKFQEIEEAEEPKDKIGFTK